MIGRAGAVHAKIGINAAALNKNASTTRSCTFCLNNAHASHNMLRNSKRISEDVPPPHTHTQTTVTKQSPQPATLNMISCMSDITTCFGQHFFILAETSGAPPTETTNVPRHAALIAPPRTSCTVILLPRDLVPQGPDRCRSRPRLAGSGAPAESAVERRDLRKAREALR